MPTPLRGLLKAGSFSSDSGSRHCPLCWGWHDTELAVHGRGIVKMLLHIASGQRAWAQNPKPKSSESYFLQLGLTPKISAVS